MEKSKHFNGKLVTDYISAHKQLWKPLCNALWPENKQQSKDYFLKVKDVRSDTLWIIHDVTGLPLDNLFIGDGEEQPDVETLNSKYNIHHNQIDTLNADSNPDVLLAYIEMTRKLSDEKDKRIEDMQSIIKALTQDRDDLLRRYPEANPGENK